MSEEVEREECAECDHALLMSARTEEEEERPRSEALREAARDFDRLMKAYKRFGDELSYFHAQALRIPERLLEPHDGGSRVRPHTIKGWWQVWSGGICIALLKPEDVEPLQVAREEQ